MCPEELRAGRTQGIETLPVIIVIHFPQAGAPPQGLENAARAILKRAEQIITRTTGDRLIEFTYIIMTEDGPPYFQMVPPCSRKRRRLSFGKTREAFQGNIERIRIAADEDPGLAFAMAMFTDAPHEPIPLFKVCRLFNVLASLAYSLKNDDTGSALSKSCSVLSIAPCAVSK